MNFNHDAMRRIAQTVQKKEHGQKPHGPVARGPRTVLPNRNAVTTSAISARSGMVKGHGTVNILCDDGTGSGTDKVLLTGVKIWNPYTSSVASGLYVTVVITDGLYMIAGASCPPVSS